MGRHDALPSVRVVERQVSGRCSLLMVATSARLRWRGREWGCAFWDVKEGFQNVVIHEVLDR